jgi:phage terminase large subunit-like protein
VQLGGLLLFVSTKYNFTPNGLLKYWIIFKIIMHRTPGVTVCIGLGTMLDCKGHLFVASSIILYLKVDVSLLVERLLGKYFIFFISLIIHLSMGSKHKINFGKWQWQSINRVTYDKNQSDFWQQARKTNNETGFIILQVIKDIKDISLLVIYKKIHSTSKLN